MKTASGFDDLGSFAEGRWRWSVPTVLAFRALTGPGGHAANLGEFVRRARLYGVSPGFVEAVFYLRAVDVPFLSPGRIP